MAFKYSLIFFVLLFLISSCAYSGAKKFADVPEEEFKIEEMNFDEDFKEFAAEEMNYTVGVGDEIKVTIYGNPQDSTQTMPVGEIFGYSVDENGEVNIPLLKQVKVAGLTRSEVVAKLEEGYSKFIKEPHVMFDIVKYGSKFYYVIGNVKNAGKNPIKLNTNLLEAVTGMVPSSTSEKMATEFIYLKRGEKVLPISISEMATGARDFSKYYLKDGDTFYVPAPSANRAYILGEVKKPGAFEIIDNNYTMIDLIADAGGLVQPNAADGRIYMIRQNGGKHLLVQFHFDDIMTGKAGLVRLMPGDRVYVATMALVSYNRILQQITPTFSLFYTSTLIHKNWAK